MAGSARTDAGGVPRPQAIRRGGRKCKARHRAGGLGPPPGSPGRGRVPPRRVGPGSERPCGRAEGDRTPAHGTPASGMPGPTGRSPPGSSGAAWGMSSSRPPQAPGSCSAASVRSSRASAEASTRRGRHPAAARLLAGVGTHLALAPVRSNGRAAAGRRRGGASSGPAGRGSRGRSRGGGRAGPWAERRPARPLRTAPPGRTSPSVAIEAADPGAAPAGASGRSPAAPDPMVGEAASWHLPGASCSPRGRGPAELPPEGAFGSTWRPGDKSLRAPPDRISGASGFADGTGDGSGRPALAVRPSTAAPPDPAGRGAAAAPCVPSATRREGPERWMVMPSRISPSSDGARRTAPGLVVGAIPGAVGAEGRDPDRRGLRRRLPAGLGRPGPPRMALRSRVACVCRRPRGPRARAEPVRLRHADPHFVARSEPPPLGSSRVRPAATRAPSRMMGVSGRQDGEGRAHRRPDRGVRLVVRGRRAAEAPFRIGRARRPVRRQPPAPSPGERRCPPRPRGATAGAVRRERASVGRSVRRLHHGD